MPYSKKCWVARTKLIQREMHLMFFSVLNFFSTFPWILKEISRRYNPLKILFCLLKLVCYLFLDKYKCLFVFGFFLRAIMTWLLMTTKKPSHSLERQRFKYSKNVRYVFCYFIFIIRYLYLKAKKHIVV